LCGRRRKMSDIMTVASRVRDYLQLHNPDLIPTLSEGQFFELSDEVMDAVGELAKDITIRRAETRDRKSVV
jgi:hypothetical protein